jgi:hypothetical protein
MSRCETTTRVLEFPVLIQEEISGPNIFQALPIRNHEREVV